MMPPLAALAIIVTLTACGEKAPLEPPVETGIVREIIYGKERHQGLPLRLSFVPAGPFAPVPLLRALSVPGARGSLEVRLRVPGCKALADLEGAENHLSGKVEFALPDQAKVALIEAYTTFSVLTREHPLPRCRLTLRGEAEGKKVSITLEGPVTTLDGRLIFQGKK